MMQLPAFLSGVVSHCFWLAQFILLDGVRVFAASSSTFSARRILRVRIFALSMKIDPLVFLPLKVLSVWKGSAVRERSECEVEV
jgi:hypothetical protein